jgi:hypothetical protein
VASTNAPPSSSAKPKQLALRIERLHVAGAILSLKRDPPAAGVPAAPAPPPAALGTNSPGGILLLLQSLTNALALVVNSTNALSATVSDLSITNCAVNLEGLANARPARLNLDEICLNARDLSNLPRTNMTAALSLRWNTNGAIHTELSASLAPPAADIHLKLDALELRPLDPYLDAKLNVFVLGSKLGLDSRLRLRTTSGALPEVSFAGDAWLNDFNTIDGVLAEGLLKWDSVRISGIDANLNPAVVAIGRIAVDGAYARLIIETNRTINLLAALRMSADTNMEAEVSSATNGGTLPPVEKSAVFAGDSLIATNALSEFPLKKLSVGSLVVSNAHADFTDRSLKPNVSLAIEQINGAVAGLSSDPMQHADVDLRAKVDNVGPVAITGTINPFRPDATNEVRITMSDVDLTAASSYAGKYAGYRIAKGKLSLTLAYHVHGRSIRSENMITLDQFTFGEKVDSPDATKLPVRLAIAVLKDRDGKIVLDVPIEGSLDDPKFKLRKVIIRTLGNIFMKTVTSPFAVLGSLFGGMGEEIRYQDFAPASVELLAGSKGKLDALIKALYERPGLQLEIEGSVDPAADRDGLRMASLEKQLRAQKWLALRKSDRTATTPEQVIVAPEERAALVKRLYADAMSKGLIVASSTNADGVATPLPPVYVSGTIARGGMDLLKKEVAAPVAETARAQFPGVTDSYELAFLTSLPVTETELQTLAADRAKAVREYFLQTGKVEAERLFLTENQTAVKREGSRVYLQLR